MNTPKLDGIFELTVSHWLANDLEDYLPSGIFIWDTRLQAAFPADHGWWLYGTLPE